jgi:hypothetical protein
MEETKFGSGPNGGLIVPRYVTKQFRLDGTAPATAGNFGTVFFIANEAYEVVAVRERHATAGSNGGAVTGMLKKVPSGTAAGSGTDMLSAGIDLKATADTNQSGTLSATAANTRLAAGDGLAFVLTGTPTSLAGLCLQVTLKRI